MLIQKSPPIHLTYCMNVHPGESWAENFTAIRTHAAAIRDAICPARPFGLGLRFSARAADELLGEGGLVDLKNYLLTRNMYAFTINGFPFGRFHGATVKQEVYRPDWRTSERRDYTIKLGKILAELLPEGVSGSISTLPGSYRQWIAGDQDVRLMAENIGAVAAAFDDIRRATGKVVRLAIEPEADCFIETTDQAIEFITSVLPQYAGADETTIRRHVGICLDTSHQAVQFEDLASVAQNIQAAGMTIAKIQLSSAVAAHPTPVIVKWLGQFRDVVYLHQLKIRKTDGQIVAHSDLADALDSPANIDPADMWRVHFHVPLFFEGHAGLQSTSGELVGDFATMIRSGLCDNVEIETYTMDVLPDFLRPASIDEAIIREYRWAAKNIFHSTEIE